MIDPRLSAILCLHNEEARLATCLARLAFTDEIVCVLDRCTDRTREIALAFGARVIEGAFEIEGDRRNAAIAAATGDWLLEVDADELIPEALATEIRAIVRTTPAHWHRLRVDNYVGDRLIRHGWGAAFGRGQVAALFRRDAKSWGAQRVHPKIDLRGPGGAPLDTPLEHYVDANISDMIRRLDRYTTANARDLRESGTGGSLGRNVGRLFTRFYKCYVRRKGYREGGWGFLIALMAGLYPLLSHLKATLEND